MSKHKLKANLFLYSLIATWWVGVSGYCTIQTWLVQTESTLCTNRVYHFWPWCSNDHRPSPQIGCFNHRVVNLVTDLARETVDRFVDKGNPKGSYQDHLQPQHTDNPHDICEGITCLRQEHGSPLLQFWSAVVMTPSKMFWGLSVYCGCKVNRTCSYFLGCFVQLGFHSKETSPACLQPR